MIYIILVAVALAAIVIYAIWKRQSRVAEKIDTLVGFKLPPTPRYRFTTARGVTVFSQTVPSGPAEYVLGTAIDDGITQFLSSTAHLKWQYFRLHTDFLVWLLNPTSYSLEGYPSLNMLDGTKIAGIAYGVQTIHLPTPIIVVPYAPNHPAYQTAAVRHEAEHIGAWKSNDIAEAERGSVPGHIHPLYRLPSGEESAIDAAVFCCGGCPK